MATITAAMVKDLREKTGAGMMDCKTALKENAGNLEAAIDWLRTKGLAKAAKKAGRVAAEGLVAAKSSGTVGVVVEVNSETDFVARNETFQSMVSTIAETSLGGDGTIESLLEAPYPGASRSVAEQVTEMVATIGENMNVRRVQRFEVEDGVVASYVHGAVVEGLGRMGVVVALKSTGDKGVLQAFGRQVAMHIAAVNPLSVTSDQLDADVIEREKAVLTEQARESGKPDNIIEKMVEGRIRKYFEEVVLLEQAFVIDTDKTVGKALEAAAGEAGAPVEITGFARFALGEGIEKEEDDFAAEVASMAGKS